ncbi:MAG: metallophosphoesterase [Candidatus Acidiferrum sp.]
MLRRFAVFLSVFQAILFLAHFLLFRTILAVWGPLAPPNLKTLVIVLAVLSISFLGSALLAFQNASFVVRVMYVVGAVWLGTFNYLFIAAAAWWILHEIALAGQLSVSGSLLGALLFGAALLTSAYGVINASWTRVKRIHVRLTDLPESWRGRTIALISDLHLGHVRNAGFLRRVVTRINRERPDLVIIAGDLFDGTAIDPVRAAAPLSGLKTRFGTYFSEGNHEEFRDPRPYLEAISRSGVRILDQQKVELDGLQLIGIAYRDATHTEHMRSVLASLAIDRTRASILITHAPDRPAVAAEAGVSLQVSGHTHGGQFFPYTWIANRIYRQFSHGLSRLENLQVLTSYGAGTWGPPLRVGTEPEIILIQLSE